MLHETTAQDLAALKMHLARLNRTSEHLSDSERSAITESMSLAEQSMIQMRIWCGHRRHERAHRAAWRAPRDHVERSRYDRAGSVAAREGRRLMALHCEPVFNIRKWDHPWR